MTVSGTNSTWTNSGGLWVGYYSNGALGISAGGSVGNVNGQISFYPDSTSSVTVSGNNSNWTNSGYLNVGVYGDATLSITGGAAVSSMSGNIGYFSGSTSAVTVSGANSKWTNTSYLAVGVGGYGTLNIADGGLVEANGGTWVPSYTGSGAINFDGSGTGTLTTAGLMSAASSLSGTGTINTTGLVSDEDLVFDASHGLAQILTFNGAGQNITVNLNVDGSAAMGAGYAGSGSLHISDGLAVQSTHGFLGNHPGSTGLATVSGAGSIWATSYNLTVGRNGDGSLTIDDGGLVRVGDTLFIDNSGGGDSYVSMTSGGMLALLGNADDSLTSFLGLIDDALATNPIRYWNEAFLTWDSITNATPGVDYTLTYQTAGDLAGYTDTADRSRLFTSA